MHDTLSMPPELRTVVSFYADLEQVNAVVLGGSTSANFADDWSDLDLYIYYFEPVPVSRRASFIKERASHWEIDCSPFEPGDFWLEFSGVRFDVMYRELSWIENELHRTVRKGHASLGYSTCLWHNVLTSKVLYDPHGWFAKLRGEYSLPYPNSLQCSIIAHNHPWLRSRFTSFSSQLLTASRRKDSYAVHHRCTALLASYFDILFALNKTPHPGEKRIFKHLRSLQRVPGGCELGVANLLTRLATSDTEAIAMAVETLLDDLDALLARHGLLQLPLERSSFS